jgi:hypothetical protein
MLNSISPRWPRLERQLHVDLIICKATVPKPVNLDHPEARCALGEMRAFVDCMCVTFGDWVQLDTLGREQGWRVIPNRTQTAFEIRDDSIGAPFTKDALLCCLPQRPLNFH